MDSIRIENQSNGSVTATAPKFKYVIDSKESGSDRRSSWLDEKQVERREAKTPSYSVLDKKSLSGSHGNSGFGDGNGYGSGSLALGVQG